MRAIRMLLVSALALGSVSAFAGEQDVQRLTQLLEKSQTIEANFSQLTLGADGTSLQVINEAPTFEPGTGRMFGPFPAVPGKRTSLVNVRVGSSAMPKATGFSYRVSVEGCN